MKKPPIRIRYKEQGLCTRCGGPREDEDRTTCRKCRIIASTKSLAYRTKRKAQGLCTICGTPLPKYKLDKGSPHCAPCTRKIKDRHYNLLKKRAMADQANKQTE